MRSKGGRQTWGRRPIGIAKLGERYLDDDEAAALARAADDAIQMIEQERYTCGNDLCHWSDKMWDATIEPSTNWPKQESAAEVRAASTPSIQIKSMKPQLSGLAALCIRPACNASAD